MKVERNKRIASTRNQQAEATKRKLQETMLALLEEKDFEDISILDIANRANISNGLFYHYYKSRTELVQDLSYLLDKSFDSDAIREAVSKGKSAEERVLLFFDMLASYYAEPANSGNSVLQKVMELTFLYPGTNMFESISNKFIILGEIVNDGIKNGEFVNTEDANEICILLSTTMCGIAYRWYVEKKNFDIKGVTKYYLMLALRSYLPGGTFSIEIEKYTG